jgi:Ca2+:H+ antiporter
LSQVLKISHGVAILLLISYIAYLSFTLWTHAYLYSPPEPLDPNDPNAIAPMAPLAPSNYPGETVNAPPEGAVFRIPSLPSWGGSDDGSSSTSSASSESTIESHEPKMSGRVAILLLTLVTVVCTGPVSAHSEREKADLAFTPFPFLPASSSSLA